MTWQLVLAVFSPVRNPLLRFIFTHWPSLQQNLSFNSEDFKRTQLFTFERINLATNTAQTSANRISRPLPEVWNWQTEWKTTVDNTWVRCRIEMNQSKKTKINTWLKFRIEMNQSNTCCVSWEVLLVSWKTNGGSKYTKWLDH